jgi:hypothetical protein
LKTAVPHKAIRDHVSLKWSLILLVVAVLVGVAFNARGPDLFVSPVMAHIPVALPDGTSIYVQKYEVTVAQWNVCHAAGACTLALRVVGDRSEVVMPATGLSFDDVTRLCCTNRLEDVLALTPDGFSLRLLFGVCQER